ncbi:MAG: CBS domain-containing protein [Bacteroidaceae bacterium]|nr:CBS domain-containing protein [Bacteroidaceae bacterium]
MITDRDIVLRNVANKKDPNTTLASDIMTTDIVTVDPETDIYKVSRLMAEKQIRRIPVVQNNEIVGLVTLGDLSKEKCFDMEIASCLCDICEPTKNS